MAEPLAKGLGGAIVVMAEPSAQGLDGAIVVMAEPLAKGLDGAIGMEKPWVLQWAASSSYS